MANGDEDVEVKKEVIDFTGFENFETTAFIWPNDITALISSLKMFFEDRVRRAAVKYKAGKQPDCQMRSELDAGFLGLKLVDMKPKLKHEAKPYENLNLVLKMPFPKWDKELVEDILARWREQEEQQEVEDTSQIAPDEQSATHEQPTDETPLSPTTGGGPGPVRRPKTKTNATNRQAPFHVKADTRKGYVLRKPHPSHPIWGADGIMHGLLLDTGRSRIHYVVDPLYRPRNAKVYGDNGFKVGDWFPFQRIAHIRGLHGSHIAGISPGPDGAYSVVASASGAYSDTDLDHIDTLYYSGAGSYENTSRLPKETGGTLSLHESIRTGKPVRVLRSGGNFLGKPPKPLCGIRYDGLYRITGFKSLTNEHGGAYEQFIMKRLPNQLPVDMSRPILVEMNNYKCKDEGY